MAHHLVKRLLWALGFWAGCLPAFSQRAEDSLFIRKIFNQALESMESHKWLSELCRLAPKRLSNYPDYYKAVDWAVSLGGALGFETFKQSVEVPNWHRGRPEACLLFLKDRTLALNITALGGSGGGRVRGQVVPFATLKDLEKAPREEVEGKIVYINQGFDPHPIETGTSYGMAVGSRRNGPAIAAGKGALACLIRSMTHARDNYPHTGMTVFPEDIKPIPAAALSMVAADSLWQWTTLRTPHTLYVETHCTQRPDTVSYNVVGTWKGREKPDEFILVGGHLDAWDTGCGAHDDGAGCIHAVRALTLLKQVGYTPRRSLRWVLFTNEENGLRGAQKYYDEARQRGEKHVACLESDAGGLTPRGFRYENDTASLRWLRPLATLLQPYGIGYLRPGGSGADISPFRQSPGCLLLGYEPDSQRYFDYHHAATDVPDNVHPRELELGSACIAALIYLIDKYHP
ncbi:MAG: M20/M25/M40 family metallo-hydrolase [Flavobacteriales bacterium]|nr:M20/M25/M40 family metallo-hydrolase [Flavobacteriales bacterium]MCX7650723.1 M20/M25/M40 family metallo-hydrolase [Flavobacteriales bacterium]MDW8432676.1 M20/M25/M40 family metallo-hydrolase [Flavobacteriales bacterium]